MSFHLPKGIYKGRNNKNENEEFLIKIDNNDLNEIQPLFEISGQTDFRDKLEINLEYFNYTLHVFGASLSIYGKISKIDYKSIFILKENFDLSKIYGLSMNLYHQDEWACLNFINNLEDYGHVEIKLPNNIKFKNKNYSFKFKYIITRTSEGFSDINYKLKSFLDIFDQNFDIEFFIMKDFLRYRKLLEIFLGYETKLKECYILGKDCSTIGKVYLYKELFVTNEISQKLTRPMYKLPLSSIKDNLNLIFENFENKFYYLKPLINGYLTMYKSSKLIEGQILSIIPALEGYYIRKYNDFDNEQSEIKKIILNKVSKNLSSEEMEWIREKLKFSDKISLKNKLEKLIDLYSDYFTDVLGFKEYVNKMVDKRNYLGHFYSTQNSLEELLFIDKNLSLKSTLQELLTKEININNFLNIQLNASNNVVYVNESLLRLVEIIIFDELGLSKEEIGQIWRLYQENH
ncbi:HEPN domain-containing protein [uncultured Ilyobacter sp.]|uniref:HEPN domain-containing protein n=1 Tax=uncultured Ilyobacter sp. TaxID=544433 RepID=UPI0029BFD4FA|nr:HEPN domain-containing protein [uncultured Ilyobacter sp.]